MAIEARSEEFSRDTRYNTLKVKQDNIEQRVQTWVDEATTLHGDSSAAPADQTDIIALRDGFVLNLRTILGV